MWESKGDRDRGNSAGYCFKGAYLGRTHGEAGQWQRNLEKEGKKKKTEQAPVWEPCVCISGAVKQAGGNGTSGRKMKPEGFYVVSKKL